MANNKNKEAEKEFFLDQSNENIIEDEEDIEALKYESGSSNGGGRSDDEDNRKTQPQSFSSQIWPQSYKYTNIIHFLFILLSFVYDYLRDIFVILLVLNPQIWP